ncbi:hypothetical protein ROS62_27685 [Streptomyces sp. DSM 41972]|uniref:Uncharacterized protein n=1 Tax=Streptomyces althioticus subsp. attaecolombicae TaxID=3075534 RepID=A0ABU3I7K2_9ACTN|nr:hypothetical protein [Streptomyces sp. DSM 41972]
MITALGKMLVSLLAETRLGVLGLLLLLLLLVGAGIRAHREGLAVGAAVLLTALMIQA